MLTELQRAFRRAATVHSNPTASRFPGGVYVVERADGKYVVATDGRRLTAVRVADDTPVGVWDRRDGVRKFLKKGGTLPKPTEVATEKTYWFASPLPANWEARVWDALEPSWVVDVDAHELRRWVAGPIIKGVATDKVASLRFEWDNGLVIRAKTPNVGEARVEIPAELVDAGTRLDAVDVPMLHVADALRWHPKMTVVRIAMPVTQEKAIRFTVGGGDDITLVARDMWTRDTVPKFTIGSV